MTHRSLARLSILAVPLTTIAGLGGCVSNTPQAGPSTAAQTDRPPAAAPAVSGVVTTRPATADPGPVSPLSMSTAGGTGTVALDAGVSISYGELNDLLYKAYGIRILDDLVERGLAKQALERARDKAALTDSAAAAQLTVTPADFDAERQITLQQMFAGQDAKAADYDRLLDQFLDKSHLTATEFDVKIIQTNAYLRKLARPQMAGKIGDDLVFKVYEQMYGENRKIADVVVANMALGQEARRRVAEGEPFGKVVAELSEDSRNKGMGGEWAPFSAKSTAVPDLIRQTAFALKLGEVSDVLQVGDHCHVIKLIEVIAQQTVKFDDEVKANIRVRLEEEWLKSAISQYRQEMRTVAGSQMHLIDPTLKGEWDRLVAQQQAQTRTPADVSKQMRGQYAPPVTAPSVTPATGPAAGR